MLAHILYGTSSKVHDDLKFDARIAGPRGQRVTIEILAGDEFAVAVESSLTDPLKFGLGVGNISITVTDETKEKDLIRLCRRVLAFNLLCRVDIKLDADQQPVSMGNSIVAPLAKAALSAPATGMLQYLESRFAILGWNDRELIGKDKPVGLLFPYEEEPHQKEMLVNAMEKHLARFQVGIAFQTKHKGEDENREAFVTQNCMIDLFREQLYFSIKRFWHPLLAGQIGGEDTKMERFGYHNSLKDEVESTVFENARLRVVGSYQFFYKHPAHEFTDLHIVGPGENQFGIGLWVEPLDEAPGPGGDEFKDAEINFPVSEE